MSMRELLLSRTLFSVATPPWAAQVATRFTIRALAEAVVLEAAAEPAIIILAVEGGDSAETAARSFMMAAAAAGD